LKDLSNSSAHGNVQPLAADLADSKERKRVSDFVEENWPHVDVLINNAGALVNKPFEEMTEEDFDKMATVNYKVPYFLTQQLIPYLSHSSCAQVLNVGSIGGLSGYSKFPGLSVYSSSKGALSILTECLATELKDKDIAVNCYALGSVQTEMLEQAFPGMEAGSSASSMARYLAGQLNISCGLLSGKNLPIAGTGI